MAGECARAPPPVPAGVSVSPRRYPGPCGGSGGARPPAGGARRGARRRCPASLRCFSSSEQPGAAGREAASRLPDQGSASPNSSHGPLLPAPGRTRARGTCAQRLAGRWTRRPPRPGPAQRAAALLLSPEMPASGSSWALRPPRQPVLRPGHPAVPVPPLGRGASLHPTMLTTTPQALAPLQPPGSRAPGGVPVGRARGPVTVREPPPVWAPQPCSADQEPRWVPRAGARPLIGAPEGPHWGVQAAPGTGVWRVQPSPTLFSFYACSRGRALDTATAAGWGAQTPHCAPGGTPSVRTQPGG